MPELEQHQVHKRMETTAISTFYFATYQEEKEKRVLKTHPPLLLFLYPIKIGLDN